MKDSKIYSILTITVYLVTTQMISLSVKNYVCDFINRNYNDVAMDDILRVMNTLSSQNIMLMSNRREDSVFLRLREAGKLWSDTSYETRMGLLAFFIGLSLRSVSLDREKLCNVALLLSLDDSEVDILLSMVVPRDEASPREKALRVLGLPAGATEEEIKTAYRNLSLKYHPDRNRDKSLEEQNMVEQRFREIVAAKQLLNDMD